MNYTIKLSGGPNRQKFGGRTKKQIEELVQSNLDPKVDMKFVSSGKVDYIVMPNDVETPSKTALGRAYEDTEVLHLSEFLRKFHISEFTPTASRTTKKESKKTSQKKSSQKKSSQKKSSQKKSSQKKSSQKKSSQKKSSQKKSSQKKSSSKKSSQKKCVAKTQKGQRCKNKAISIKGVSLYCNLHFPK
jgi:glucan-binding YG repeat protein